MNAILNFTDGYSIQTKLYGSYEDAKAAMDKAYADYTPDENQEECEEISYCNDYKAILYRNNEDVFVWSIFVMPDEENEVDKEKKKEYEGLIEECLKEGIITEEEGKFSLIFAINGENVEWSSKADILADFLSNDAWDERYNYNPKSAEYAKALLDASRKCEAEFPELYNIVFGSDSSSDLMFTCGADMHSIYYFNPDSTAGGQIVRCPFDDEMAERMMVDPEYYLDILAERTQYLSDVNTNHFFDTIDSLINAFKKGEYVGVARSDEERNGLIRQFVASEKLLFDEIKKLISAKYGDLDNDCGCYVNGKWLSVAAVVQLIDQYIRK